MIVSIEVPVFKGHFLQQCIDSVLNQTSSAWRLSLVWDGGDQLSREILERINSKNHPNIDVYFTPNQGIARARAFLSAKTHGEYILPLDDDDELAPNAVEVFLEAAKAKPWASLIRAQRDFIDQQSEVVEENQWFPFGPRNYYKGMVRDVFNQAQPYLIRRSAYEKTLGWRGFDDFMQAGEDCDIFLQLEQVAHFELIDSVLYHYRLHNERASDALTSAAAFEMWRRLADDTLQRIGLPLERTNDSPPFMYRVKEQPEILLKDLQFVVQNHSPLVEKLEELGSEKHAIIEAPANSKSRNWRMAGFQATNAKVVCFIDDTVMISDSKALDQLIAAFNHSKADVLNLSFNQLPKEESQLDKSSSTSEIENWLHCACLLVRRQVILATGGFDEIFIPEAVQDFDFFLQAQSKGFNCSETSISGIQTSKPFNITLNDEDVFKLQQKWQSHQSLSDVISSLSKFSGVGAR